MGDMSLSKVKEYFGYESLSEFGADWRALSEDDREQIKSGLEDGTLTY